MNVVIGNAIGESNEELGKRYYKLISACVLCLLLVLATCLIVARKTLINLFTDQPDVVDLALQLMPILALRLIFDGMQGFL